MLFFNVTEWSAEQKRRCMVKMRTEGVFGNLEALIIQNKQTVMYTYITQNI